MVPIFNVQIDKMLQYQIQISVVLLTKKYNYLMIYLCLVLRMLSNKLWLLERK